MQTKVNKLWQEYDNDNLTKRWYLLFGLWTFCFSKIFSTVVRTLLEGFSWFFRYFTLIRIGMIKYTAHSFASYGVQKTQRTFCAREDVPPPVSSMYLPGFKSVNLCWAVLQLFKSKYIIFCFKWVNSSAAIANNIKFKWLWCGWSSNDT